MGSSRRGMGRLLVAGLTAALLAVLACAATALGASSTRTLTIGAGRARSSPPPPPTPGGGGPPPRWPAPADSSMQARLLGNEANDWDLALFDARSGRRLDA